VRSVVWSADDTRVVTCGADGAVYEWEVLTGRRLAENVLKQCSYSGVALSPDAKTTFAVGSDRTLKEITDSQVVDSDVKISFCEDEKFHGSSYSVRLSFMTSAKCRDVSIILLIVLSCYTVLRKSCQVAPKKVPICCPKNDTL